MSPPLRMRRKYWELKVISSSIMTLTKELIKNGSFFGTWNLWQYPWNHVIYNILSNLKYCSGLRLQNWGSYKYYSYKMSTFKKKVRVRLKWHIITPSPCNPDSLHSQGESFPSVPLKDTDIWWKATLDWAWALQMSRHLWSLLFW